MFKQLDNELNYLTNTSDNYFYDEGFIKVQQILTNFTKADYEQLLNSLNTKSLKYKEYLAYVISDKDIEISEVENYILRELHKYI